MDKAHTTVVVDEWATPATRYPRTRMGNARIRTHIMPVGTYMGYRTRVPSSMVPFGHENVRADFIEVRAPIITTELTVGNKTWMVDDPPHWWGIQELAEEYEGHVVCAGLGLGLIAHALEANPKVTRVTIVERNLDVVRLVGPLIPGGSTWFPGKSHIIDGDWWHIDPVAIRTSIVPYKGVQGVYFDLFVGPSEGLLDEAVEALRWCRKAFPGALVHVFGFPTWLLEAKMLGDEAWEQFKAGHPTEYDTLMRSIQTEFADKVEDEDDD